MKNKRGTAIIIVLALLTVMSLFILSNGSTLNTLSDYLKDLDQRQQQKFKK